VVSGAKIAGEIGIGRSEVWRLVQLLRALGVRVVGRPTIGYQLEAMPDLLLPEVLEPLVAGTIFSSRLHHFFRTDSTNSAAMAAGQAGEPEGAVFFAEEQTAGRGRGGHSWLSLPSAGIYVSVLLRPALPPADILGLSFMSGLAAAAAVEEITGLKPDLRWPNDLLLGRRGNAELGVLPQERKFCGILTELNAEATRVRFAVAGIGINVNQEQFPGDLAGTATSLRLETGREWSRVKLAAALLRCLDHEYNLLCRGFSPVRPDARAKPGPELRSDSRASAAALFSRFEQSSSYARGRRVQVDESGGFTGTTAGLDSRGFLLVRADDGTLRTVMSGVVRAL
jgi:BirA family biotin operon repressor/biotin-[acetyl-CoA-carboxylase] ligase